MVAKELLGRRFIGLFVMGVANNLQCGAPKIATGKLVYNYNN